MLSLYLGITGFLLYLLYDINSFTYQARIPRTFFISGSVLIGAATVLDLRSAWKLSAFSGVLDVPLLAAGTMCFATLIYSLFFALPFRETYTEQKNGRKVYEGGIYALCRHPGILCFAGMYLCLGLAALPGALLYHGLVFSLLNLAYAWFQDRVTFPKTFCNYETYRKRVPFLFPTGDSIRLARQTWVRSVSKEDES